MNAENIISIMYNPFWGSKLIPHFLSGSSSLSIKTELVYLLFPLVFYQESRKILANARENSTLSNTFLDVSDGRKALAGIEKRYAYFKPLTNQSLIVVANTHLIEIGDFLKAQHRADYKEEKDDWCKGYYKASRYLGLIFSRTPYLDIFIKLGLKDL